MRTLTFPRCQIKERTCSLCCYRVPVSTSRRRGDALREAVFDAALAEVAEHGLRGASMTRIAQRAGTGKAALYRRWPNVRALALDVFISTLEANQAHAADTGSLRSDLLESMTGFSDQLDGNLGIVLRELLSEAVHDPDQIGRAHV